MCRKDNSRSCSATRCTSKPSTAAKSKTTNSTARNWRCCCAAATSPPPTPTPKRLRATRDLLRRRTHLVRRRAQTLTHIQIVNHQQNLPPVRKEDHLHSPTEPAWPSDSNDPSVRASIELDLDLLGHYDNLHSQARTVPRTNRQGRRRPERSTGCKRSPASGESWR